MDEYCFILKKSAARLYWVILWYGCLYGICFYASLRFDRDYEATCT